MSSEFGKNIKFSFFGQSHSQAVGVLIDGLPAGFKPDMEDLGRFMKRRVPGRDKTTTSRSEADKFEIISGLYENKTCGAPLCAIIPNTDIRSGAYAETAFIPRPSHADYAASVKYGGFNDPNGGGHFSARLTAPLCLAGGICLQILKSKGIRISSHIKSIGNINDDEFCKTEIDVDLINQLSDTDFPVINSEAAEKMRDEIEKARLAGDSVGGIVECVITGVPAGLGSPIYEGIENRIAQTIFGIPAVKGIEFGNGFDAASLRGSKNNDAFHFDGETVKTKTNNSGGINGGISNGMPIIFSVAFKPTPSIAKPQETVDLREKINRILEIKGRHDPCVVSRACPCVEAAAAAVILDMLMEEKQYGFNANTR